VGSWGQLAILGTLNVVLPFILFTWGQTRISSGLASVLNATTPLWGVLAAHFLTHDEKASPACIAGVLLGFAGVGTMIGSDLAGGISGSLPAQLACIAATLSYALASIYARRFGASGMPPLVIATGQVVTAALIMIPVAALSDAPWQLPMPGASALLATVALALLSTSLAYVLYFRLLESVGASNSLLVTFLMPIVAILLGALFLGEVMTGRQIAGMALIALGLAAIDGRLFRALARRNNVP
jgi:drug/metabolite transporter (DMT)-like permease